MEFGIGSGVNGKTMFPRYRIIHILEKDGYEVGLLEIASMWLSAYSETSS